LRQLRPALHTPAPERLPLLTALRRWLDLLQVLLPTGLVLLVIVYEIGPARWIYYEWGETYHFVAEILFYGTVGPALAFLLLNFLGRWLEERETSDLQAQVLAQARGRARLSHELNDDALQILFAASTFLASLQVALPELSPETTSTLRETQRALDRAIRQLRDHLQTQPLTDMGTQTK